MKARLLTKTILTISITLSAIFFLGFYTHYTSLKNKQIYFAKHELSTMADLLSFNIYYNYSIEDVIQISQLVDQFSTQTENLSAIIVTDSTGNAFVGNIRKMLGAEVIADRYKQMITNGETCIEIDTESDTWSCMTIVPIPSTASEREDIFGYLILESSLKETQEALSSVIRSQTILYAALLITLIIIITSLSNKFFIKPIRKLSKATKMVAMGKFTPLPERNTNDEISDLIRSFNTMTEKLARAMYKLEGHNRNLEKKVADEAEKLRVAARQLIENEKLSALGQLIAGVAHELNNPLAVVMGNAQLLLALGLDSKTIEKAESIYNSAVRSQKIVKNLLSFARQAPSKKTLVELNNVINDCLELKAYDYKSNGINVICDFENDLPVTMCDFHQFQQVFINILDNVQHALSEMGGDKTLRISSKSDGENIILSFKDNGPGIPPDVRARIFEPFFTTKEQGKGTGLGLSIAYGIVKKHYGELMVETEIGKSTNFIIEIPIVTDETSEITDEFDDEITQFFMNDTPNIKSNTKRILVVDDESEIAEMLQGLLYNEGFKVDVARNGKLALDRIQKTDYDIIISDIKMPVIGGEQLFEIVRRQYPELMKRFIFITGDIVNPDTADFVKMTGCPYIEKPFKFERLKRIIIGMIPSPEYVSPVAPDVFLEKSI
jgi:signal transduction histidine kinase/ActR/RegA family two-component response regulator